MRIQDRFTTDENARFVCEFTKDSEDGEQTHILIEDSTADRVLFNGNVSGLSEFTVMLQSILMRAYKFDSIRIPVL